MLKNGSLLLLFELILRLYVMRHNVDTLWLNRLGVLHLDNLIVAPHSMNDLILLHVYYLAHSVLAVILPATLIRQPTHQVLLPAIPILHVILETSIIDLFSLLLQLAMAVQLAFFEFANVLEAWPDQLPEPIRLTVPYLSLVDSTIGKLVAALACPFAVLPLARVDIAALELLSSLSMLFPILKMASVNITGLQSQHTEAMF